MWYSVSISVVFNTVKPIPLISEGAEKNKRLMRENNSSREVICAGFTGTREGDDTCVKAVRVGTMDRGFTVLFSAVSFVT
jgi:hypothetical protein